MLNVTSLSETTLLSQKSDSIVIFKFKDTITFKYYIGI